MEVGGLEVRNRENISREKDILGILMGIVYNGMEKTMSSTCWRR